MVRCYGFLLLLVVSGMVASEPVKQKDDTGDMEEVFKGFDIEYSRYLTEVSSLLEADKGFQETGKAKDGDTMEEDNLQHASEQTRTKLDELKRIELRRLKDLHKESMKLASSQQKFAVKQGRGVSRKDLPKIDDGHIYTKNPSKFVGDDLKNLIAQTTRKIANIDTWRKDDFKKHELHKAYKYKSAFRELPIEEQRQKLKDHLELAKKHPRLNHPGSKAQLHQLWQEKDMLEPETFNPKTFFMLRDVDGDGLLSSSEIEAFFEYELDKVHSGNSSDNTQREEDMNRMREHVFTEVDTDGDGMVSYEEFLKSTKSDDFSTNKGWESVNDNQQFTDEELRQFEEAVRVKDS